MLILDVGVNYFFPHVATVHSCASLREEHVTW